MPQDSAFRRWFLVGLLLFVVAGLGLGGWYVVRRGLQKEGLYEKGLRAMREERYDEAEAHFSELLKADADHLAARVQLLNVMLKSDRLDEAERVARAWRETGVEELSAARELSKILLRRGKFLEAERIARTVSDRDPEFAQLTIIKVRDLLGDRLAAQAAAVQLASISKKDLQKAELMLFAGSTLADLVPVLPEAARPAGERLSREYLDSAAKALRRARQTNKLYQEDLVLARIQIHSDSERERAAGAKSLKFALKNNPDDHFVRAALAAYYARMRDWEQALATARPLAQGPFTLWLRAARRFIAYRRVDDALAMLDGAPDPDSVIVRLERGRALLLGDEAQQAEGAQLLKGITGKDIDPRVTLSAFQLLRAGGREVDSLEVLESLSRDHADAKLEALLANVLATSDASKSRALAMVDELAGRIEDKDESLQVLRVLGRGNPAAVRRYLDRRVEAGGPDAANARFLRAVAFAILSLRDPGAEASGALRDTALADLAALRTSDLLKSEFMAAWNVALLLGEPALAGRLCARALALPGPPLEAAHAILRETDGTKDRTQIGPFAEGLREGGRGTPAEPFLALFADFVAKPGAERDRETALASLLGRDLPEASRVQGLFLALQFAWAREDVAAAAEAAARLVALRPESVQARAARGRTLLVLKDFEGALTLWEGREEVHPVAYRQRSGALWQLDRKEKAFAVARDWTRAHPADPSAHVHLARLHLASAGPGVEPDKEQIARALGALNVAPAVPPVMRLRARLLQARGEVRAAELEYLGVLNYNTFDLEAWQGLQTLMIKTRPEELLKRLTAVLSDARTEQRPDIRGELLVQRGFVHEQMRRYDDALTDFRQALQLRPDEVRALNDAAWIIVSQRAQDIEEAQRYIDHALTIVPDHPSVRHTAAIVYLKLGEPAQALAHVDRAIEASTAVKPVYLVDRAEALLALGRKDEAAKEARRVIRDFDSVEAKRRADRLLRSLEE